MSILIYKYISTNTKCKCFICVRKHTLFVLKVSQSRLACLVNCCFGLKKCLSIFLCMRAKQYWRTQRVRWESKEVLVKCLEVWVFLKSRTTSMAIIWCAYFYVIILYIFVYMYIYMYNYVCNFYYLYMSMYVRIYITK